MTIIATCGHEVTFETEVICNLKAMTREGAPAVSTEALCQSCYDELLKLGYVLETDFEYYSYLAGLLEIKNR
jgi:hypothetical protein